MRDKNRLALLKALSYAAIFSFVYPLLASIRKAIFNIGIEYTDIGFDITCLILGIIIAFLIYSSKTHKFIRIFLIFDAFIFPSLAAILFMFNGNWGRIIFELLVSYTLLIIGFRGYRTNYDAMLSIAIIETGIFLVGASFFFDFYFSLNFSNELALFSYTFLVIIMIIKNQGNIDKVFLKMNRQLSGVAKNMRKFNIIIIIFFISITILLFNAKGIVKIALKGIVFIIGRAIWLFGEILYLFLGDLLKKGPQENNSQSDKIDIIKSPKNGVAGIIEIVVLIIVVLAIVFALYKLVPSLLRNLKKLIFRIISYIKSVFARYEADTGSNDDYKDELEQLDPVKDPVIRREEKERMFKRSFRSLRKITDPGKRVRFLYLLVLDYLRGREIDISDSDTTGEICEKSDTLVKISDMKGITRIYDQIRYGDMLPQENEIANAEQYYFNLTDASKKIKKL